MLGVHFPSDNIFGLQVAAAMVKDAKFMKKYFSPKNISIEASSALEQQTYNDFNQNRQLREDEVFGGLPKPPQKAASGGLSDSQVFGGIPNIPQQR